MSENNGDFARRFRPQSFDEVVGQETAVAMLQDWLVRDGVPHCVLFSGPSGVGKTTLARILAKELGCVGFDLDEVNAADKRKLEDVRALLRTMNLVPAQGKCRVCILDEAHQLTKREGGDAQTALFKDTEEPPSHFYWMLCTTDPNSLRRPLRGRCTEVACKRLTEQDLRNLILGVEEELGKYVPEAVLDKIAEAADGSAREALNLLGAVIGLKEDEQLAAVVPQGLKKQGIDLARAVMFKPKWADIAQILKDVEEGWEADDVRKVVMSYARTILLGGDPRKAGRAFALLNVFDYGGYRLPAKVEGHAVLAKMCWEVARDKD